MRPLLALSLLAAIGCQEAQEQVDSAQDFGRRLTSVSTQDTLTAAKAKLIDLQAEVANAKLPPELQRLRLDAIRGEIDKAQAALDLHKMEAAFEEKRRQAVAMTGSAKREAEDIKQKLDAAKATYDEASARAKRAIDALRGEG